MQTDATSRQQPDLLPCFQCRIQRQIQPLWVISRKLYYISGVPACAHGTALPANNQLPPKHGARTAFLLQCPADKTRGGTKGINIYMHTPVVINLQHTRLTGAAELHSGKMEHQNSPSFSHQQHLSWPCLADTHGQHNAGDFVKGRLG